MSLPSYIERIARHLREEKGMSEEHAVAVAINTARTFCRTGDTNFPGVQQINAGSRAEACAAITELEATEGAAPSAPSKVAGGVTERPFDSSPARFSDTQWARSCALDRGPTIKRAKARYALPIREPEGTLNLLALEIATSRIGTVKASATVIRAAARALLAAYTLAKKVPPESLLKLAGVAVKAAQRQPKQEQRDVLIEERSAPLDAPAPRIEGNKLCGLIPYGIESRDLGGWTERLEPGSLTSAVKDDLVATLGHDVTRILGRYPTTLTTEDREDGMAWEVELPNGPTGQDVREAVSRGDLKATSWRMIVGRDRWEGDLRVVEEIRELRDVAVVALPAYPTAVELRSQPVPRPEPRKEEHEMEAQEVVEEEVVEEPEVEERANGAGGLSVEERSAAPVEAMSDIEERVLDAIRGVQKGEARALTTAEATGGGAITPPELASHLFDKMRPRSVALASGIRTIPTDRNEIQWPGVVSDPDADWFAETEEITASDPVFRTLTAEPKKLATRTEFSNEVLDDSEPSAADVVRNLMLRSMAFKLDRAVFEGNPSTNPDSIRGLKFVAGTQTLAHGGANGAALTNLDVISAAIAMLEAVDAEPGAIVMPARTWGKIRDLKDADERPLVGDFASAADRKLFGVPVFFTTHLAINETAGTSSDASSIYVYSTDPDIGPAIVRRKDAEVLLDRSRLFHKDMSEMRGKTRVDLLVPQPTAVVRVTGVRP